MALSAKEIWNCWDASFFTGRRKILEKAGLARNMTEDEINILIRKRSKQLSVFESPEISRAIKEHGSCMFE